MSRSELGRASPVAWLPNSTVRDCRQRLVAARPTNSSVLLTYEYHYTITYA